MTDIHAIAARLDEAAVHARATPQLKEQISVAEAYEVQRLSMDRRYARGERRIGIKMGLTSRAKMAQMGVEEVIWGRLTDAMLIDDGASIRHGLYVHPRVEPEIAFLIERPLGPSVTPMAALAAVGGVAAALEIIDSRYENFKFSLTDVIADNSSSSAFVVGPWADPAIDIANLGMVVRIDGEVRMISSSAAILGHPLRSLVSAAHAAAAAGEPLQPGDVVLAGGATAAEALAPGQHVRLEVERLGSVDFRVEA